MKVDLANQAIALLGRCITSTRKGLASTSSEGLNGIDKFIAISMAWRCSSRSEGILLLLKAGHSDEGAILLRSLLADAQKLEYMRICTEDRLSLAIRLWKSRLRNIRTMLDQGEKSQQPASSSDSELQQKIDSADKDLDDIIRRADLGKLKKFPVEGRSMASALGRLDDQMDYVMCSQTAHGTILGTGVHFSPDENGRPSIPIKTDHPEMLLGVAGRALQYLYLASVAGLEIIDSPMTAATKQEGERAWADYSELQRRIVASSKNDG